MCLRLRLQWQNIRFHVKSSGVCVLTAVNFCVALYCDCNFVLCSLHGSVHWCNQSLIAIDAMLCTWTCVILCYWMQNTFPRVCQFRNNYPLHCESWDNSGTENRSIALVDPYLSWDHPKIILCLHVALHVQFTCGGAWVNLGQQKSMYPVRESFQKIFHGKELRYNWCECNYCTEGCNWSVLLITVTGCCVVWKICLYFTGMEQSSSQTWTLESLILLTYVLLISSANSLMFI